MLVNLFLQFLSKSKSRSANAPSADVDESCDSAPPVRLKSVLREMEDSSRQREEFLLDKLSLCGLQEPTSSTPVAIKAEEPGHNFQILDFYAGSSADKHERFWGGQVAGKSSGQIPGHVRAPPSLELGASLQDFVGWRACWEDYATSVQLHRLSVKEQIA